MDKKRSRSWCFTLNNYTLEDESRIKDCVDGVTCRYVCYGREVGESGTPHLQGFVYFCNAVSLKFCRERLGNAHFETTKGTTEQACKYCEKDGDFHEQGERPISASEKGKAEQERWKLARAAAVAGDLDSIDDDIFVRFYRTLKEIKKDYMGDVPDANECTGVWIYGVAGIGKSRKAREDYPNAYLKMANKWWDGYQKEEFVIIDDVDTKHDCLGHHFKIWGDRYSFLAETKGGAIKIRPSKVVITSQYRIDQIWTDQETVDALTRRYFVIHMDGFSII
nr:MAG: replication associated protein [Cressdnaviricota sp.]